MKRTIVFGIICTVGIAALFITTDPRTAPSWMLALPFALFYAALSAVAIRILRKRGVPLPNSVRVGLLCAFVPVALLVLQSIGQLTTKDVLSIGAFLAVAYFYLSRTRLPAP